MVDVVLNDIFKMQNIRNEVIIIKSDNVPTQYKNKYAFFSMQQLADTYNCTILRTYGAAGHGKGVVDSMSPWGVKDILRRDIVGQDLWWGK